MSTTLATYTIRIKEPLDAYWQEWFDGVHFSEQEGETLFIGTQLDQVALHSLLIKIHNLGLTLLSVNQIENVPADAHNAHASEKI